MKISCTQENLNHGLFVVSHLATKGASLPILNNVLVQVRDKTITFSTTNLEIAISCTVRGKIEEDGDFTIQSRLLADYVGLLPKEPIDLTAPNEAKPGQDQILSVKCKNHTTKIKGQPAADFPLIPQVKKENPYAVEYEEFRKAVSQVIFAVSTSETRPEIGGVFFGFTDGVLTLAATDSYRLAERSLPLQLKSAKREQKVIVPVQTLQELLRILGSFKDPSALADVSTIEIFLVENQILFSFAGIELVSRLIDGQYPDYQQIIPQRSNTQATLDVSDFVKAAKTTSLFARSGIYDVSVEFLPKQKEVVISSTNTQLGESIARLGGEMSGDDGKMVLNYRYLLDGLQNSNADQVEVDLVDASNPCVIKPVGKDANYLYIIMPIKQ